MEEAIAAVEALNDDRTKLGLEPGFEPFGVAPVLEGADLHGVDARFGGGARDCAGVQNLQPHERGPGTDHLNRLGRGVGQVNDAALDERAAVVDAHLHTLAVRKVVHPHPDAEGKRAVRGGQVVHVVGLAARRRPPVKGMAVPGREALFALRDFGRRWSRSGRTSRRRSSGRRLSRAARRRLCAGIRLLRSGGMVLAMETARRAQKEGHAGCRNPKLQTRRSTNRGSRIPVPWLRFSACWHSAPSPAARALPTACFRLPYCLSRLSAILARFFEALRSSSAISWRVAGLTLFSTKSTSFFTSRSTAFPASSKFTAPPPWCKNCSMKYEVSKTRL